jgi:CheY-like chemotaxis protein
LGDGDEKAWFVRLAVSDSGAGMDEATLRHAFEPFYTTKPSSHGTGLGLASVYGIVRAAGGLARLYSEPGHGTTVKIYLPECATTLEEQAQHSAPEKANRQVQPARILVVEDNPTLAEVFSRLLQPAGYTVLVAHSPRAALALLDTSPPVDLVITDIVMPDLTGPEFAAKIHERQPDMPIIYTSGYTSGVLGERAHLDTDAILIEKPFTRAIVLTAVAHALSPRG